MKETGIRPRARGGLPAGDVAGIGGRLLPVTVNVFAGCEKRPDVSSRWRRSGSVRAATHGSSVFLTHLWWVPRAWRRLVSPPPGEACAREGLRNLRIDPVPLVALEQPGWAQACRGRPGWPPGRMRRHRNPCLLRTCRGHGRWNAPGRKASRLTEGSPRYGEKHPSGRGAGRGPMRFSPKQLKVQKIVGLLLPAWGTPPYQVPTTKDQDR